MKTKSFNLLSTTTLALCSLLLLTPNGKAADKDTLDTADVKFVKHEAAAGMAVVKIGELGVTKAQRPEVKAFAEMIVTDHTKANEELKALAATKGVELSAVFRERHDFAPGSTIHLLPDLQRVHLFDAGSGRRLAA